MIRKGLLRQAARAGATALLLALATTAAHAQDQSAARAIAVVDSIKAAAQAAKAVRHNKLGINTRSRYVAFHEQEAPVPLIQLFRSRGLRNPLFVVNGVVTTGPVPLFAVSPRDIECVEFRPGRSATLEFRRGFQDGGADGVVLIWTRGSIGRKPAGCEISY